MTARQLRGVGVVGFLAFVVVGLLISAGIKPHPEPERSADHVLAAQSENDTFVLRGVIALANDEKLLVGDWPFYLYPDRLAEARPLLGKEAIVEVVLGAPRQAKDCAGTVRGVFDPATWIAEPALYKEGMVGTMRLFGVQFVDVGEVTVKVLTPKGKSYTFVVPMDLQPKLRVAVGKKVSLSAYIDAHSQHFVLEDIRVLE